MRSYRYPISELSTSHFHL
uniref:Uncharacterized protein n=1 Tax=Medicago truncatula TaxID=3880 RepID=I3T5I5_MEDTR|nr:unknown [Medicago truncatula]